MFDSSKVRIVDVTLRDGGYRNNFSFSMDYIHDHIRFMHGAGVDFVEIGYRNGSGVKIEGIGRTGLTSNEYIEELHKACPEANLGAIVHAHNISEKDIHEMAVRGIRLVRFCGNAKNLVESARLAQVAKSVGMTTTINIVRISAYSMEELDTVLAQAVAQEGAYDVVYTADSNGNLTPEQVGRIYQKVQTLCKGMELGFHAHDNIGQAMSNTTTVMEQYGVTFVDASLLGMGKGIGNLRLEQLIAYMQCKGVSRYDPLQILCAAHRLRNDSDYFENNEDYSVDVISGLHNLSIVERQRAADIWQNAQQLAYS